MLIQLLGCLAQVDLSQGLGDSYGMNLDEFGFAAPCYDGILLKLQRNITDNNTGQTWKDISNLMRLNLSDKSKVECCKMQTLITMDFNSDLCPNLFPTVITKEFFYC